MASFKLGKDQSVDILSKEKMKDGSKLVMGKSTKKHLSLPPSQHHNQGVTSSPSPSLITITSSSSSSLSSSTLSTASLSSSASSSTVTTLPHSFSSSTFVGTTPSSLSPIATLHDILNSIVNQRNQILGIINSIDPSFLVSVHPKSLQEHKLLNQVAELQGKILDISEEIHHMRAKNVQLEQQLTTFQGRRGAS
eukprot:c11651_g1_i1 orf=189-770(+)